MKYTPFIREAFEAAVPPIALHVGQAIADGEKEVMVDGQSCTISIQKKDCTALTVADIAVQKKMIEVLQSLRAENPKVFFRGEEEGIVNTVSEAEATHRVIIDPIDGTENYINGRRSNVESLPTNFPSLPAEQQKQWSEGVKGWSGMMAIQEKRHEAWVTVAAALYESTTKDTREKSVGRLLIAEEGINGVTVHYLNKEQQSHPLAAKHSEAVAAIADGLSLDQSLRESLQENMKKNGIAPLLHNSSGQAGIAVVTGKLAGWVQQGQYIHDLMPAAYMAEKMGRFVAIPPEFKAGKEAGNYEGSTFYPMVMAKDPVVGITLLKEMIEKKAYTMQNGEVRPYRLDEITLQTGDWQAIRYKELAAKHKVLLDPETLAPKPDPRALAGGLQSVTSAINQPRHHGIISKL